MILIGSRALKLRIGNFLKRSPLDFDWICTQEEFDIWMEKHSVKINPKKVYYLEEYHKWICEGDVNCEFEIIKPGTSSELIASLVDDEWIETEMGLIPPVDFLLAIKASHRFKKFNNSSVGFWKTAFDYHLMKSLGAKIRPEYQEFYRLREKESYADQKHPKLNVSKENFFKDDSVQYFFDHDSIHVSVAPNGIPAYTLYMKTDQPVLTDKNKFFSLPREIQLAGVAQEASVLAIERSKLIFGDTWTDKQAWTFALSKIASSITSGWFRRFSYDNIFDVLKLYPENYWLKFQQDVAQGLVKLYTGSKY